MRESEGGVGNRMRGIIIIWLRWRRNALQAKMQSVAQDQITVMVETHVEDNLQ